MAGNIVNAVCVLLILGMVYALTSEGLWGAALMFFNVLFAGLIAFNFYEPLADLVVKNASFMAGWADLLCLSLLFCVGVLVLRLTTESLAPSMVRFPTPVYHLGRFLFGILASLITMAIIILMFETAPVDKRVFKAIDYKSQPPFGMALDRSWLAFVQYSTGYAFASYKNDQVDREFGNARVFDPHASWLIDHQNARPFGDDVVPEPSGGSGGGGAGGGAGGGGGGAAPEMMPGGTSPAAPPPAPEPSPGAAQPGPPAGLAPPNMTAPG